MKKYLFNYEIIDGLITDNDFINIKERIENLLNSEGNVKNIFVEEGKEEETRLKFEDNIFNNELNYFLNSESYRNLKQYISSYLDSDRVFMFLPRAIITLNRESLPEWLLNKMTDKSRQSGVLTKYIKKQYRKCSFFFDNPLHQDWIDLPNSHSDFVTCLIPLTRRDGYNAPLYVGENNTHDEHSLIKPPFECLNYQKDYTVFRNSENKEVKIKLKRIIPNIGSTVIWGSKVFHEVRQNISDNPVINLRFNFSSNKKGLGLNDERNIYPF